MSQQKNSNICMSAINQETLSEVRSDSTLVLSDNAASSGKKGNETEDEKEDADPSDIVYPEQTMEDILHGYIQDDGSVPECTEEDGVYSEELAWTYGEITQNDVLYPFYNGPGLWLKKNSTHSLEHAGPVVASLTN
jgi:hypothetical protein